MKNRIANILKIISYVLLAAFVILLIAGLANLDYSEGIIYLSISLGAFISFALIRGFAEIIQLLEDIKRGGGLNAPAEVKVEKEELPEI